MCSVDSAPNESKTLQLRRWAEIVYMKWAVMSHSSGKVNFSEEGWI
jgi:hypothetical protein